MSLKRRDWVAWLLLLLAAVFLAWGPTLLSGSGTDGAIGTTFPENTSIVYTEPTVENVASTTITRQASYQAPRRDYRILGGALCLAGLALAVTSVFLLWQKEALLGPDGAWAVLALAGFLYASLPEAALWVRVFLTAMVLISFRELWGWLYGKPTLVKCAVHRLASRCPTPQLSLMVFAGWIAAAIFSAWGLSCQQSQLPLGLVYGCTAVCGTFGICCLWKYGTDLHHFQLQLFTFQKGLPITVRSGTFSQAETQLLQIQQQHEDAVRTAVTSERFKVELISNVSHDLRTPLTSILGYGELLRQQPLSPEGQEQLSQLNRKAGYMRDLVESLFELTKVSSGVLECKREQIDLIRLLEQTIGLFDDQLSGAGLCVRRHYEANSIPVITDGAQMHQVFANLLGNAIKYALAGSRIHLEVTSHSDRCLVRMVNTASYEMDFAPEEILQRFARGDKARATQGSGIGLAIAQTYTESVGGQFRISIDGDQFSATVELPRN